MAVITDVLGILVKANTSQLDKAMGRASSAIRTFAAGVRALAPAIGVGFGVSRITSFIKEQFNALNQIGALSSRLGIATEDLLTFEKAGRDVEVGFEEITDGLTQFIRRIGEARKVVGPTRKALRDLGINHRDLFGKDPGSLFIRVVDAIARLPNEFAKAEAAAELFGKQGPKFLNFLNLGAKGIADIKRAAASRGELFSASEIGRIKEADKAIDNMGESFNAFGRSFAITFSPAISAVAKFLDHFVQGIRRDFRLIGDEHAEMIRRLEANKLLPTSLPPRLPGDRFEAPRRIEFTPEQEVAERDLNAAFKRAFTRPPTPEAEPDRPPRLRERAPVFGRAIDLTKEFVNPFADALRRNEQKVKDEQLGDTNQILGQIRDRIGTGGVVFQ